MFLWLLSDGLMLNGVLQIIFFYTLTLTGISLLEMSEDRLEATRHFPQTLKGTAFWEPCDYFVYLRIAVAYHHQHHPHNPPLRG